MENDALYTRCPTCNTAFKVTDKLLSIAAGKVRCGACLAIFQATDFMLKTSEKQAISVSNQHDNTQPVKDDIKSHITERQNTSGDIEEISSPNIENSSEQAIDPESIFAGDDFDSGVKEKNDPEIGGKTSEAFDSNIEDLSSDDSNEFNYQNQSFDFDDQEELADPEIGAGEIREPNIENTGFEESQNSQPEYSEPELTEPKISEPEISAYEYADQETNATSFEPVSINSEKPVYKRIEEPYTSDQYAHFSDKNQDIDNFEAEEQFGAEQPSDEIESLDELSDQLSEQMQDTDSTPDPLDEFEELVTEHSSGMKTKLIYAAIAILLIVSVDRLWANRQALAWSNSWGSSIKTACQFLPCGLKERRDVSKIKVLRRQLSPDEDTENLLDIKVILVNEATFPQPYPTIKIVFSNKDGEQVSTKSYPPADYLEPDALEEHMPSELEVHINFKTEVSHPDALGFEFIFE